MCRLWKIKCFRCLMSSGMVIFLRTGYWSLLYLAVLSDSDRGPSDRCKCSRFLPRLFSDRILLYRVELQKVFFPPMYETVEETRPVAPGEKRIWTCLKIFIELRDQTTLHIPFRESSKVCGAHKDDHFSKSSIGLAVGWVNQSSKKVAAERTSFYQCCNW